MAQLRGKKGKFLIEYERASWNISEACRETGIGRSTYYRWLRSSPQFSEAIDEAKEAQVDRAESALFKKIEAGDTTAIIFTLKTIGAVRGWIEGGRRKIEKTEKEILEALISGRMSVQDAALEYAKEGIPLPDAVSIMLKTAEEPESDPGGEFPSDEILDKLYREGIARIKKQEENFLPERRKEVEELKKECRQFDSFVEDASGDP